VPKNVGAINISDYFLVNPAYQNYIWPLTADTDRFLRLEFDVFNCEFELALRSLGESEPIEVMSSTYGQLVARLSAKTTYLIEFEF
jgi:hypothetical protein